MNGNLTFDHLKKHPFFFSPVKLAEGTMTFICGESGEQFDVRVGKLACRPKTSTVGRRRRCRGPFLAFR
jgi:hypothetical protein